MLPEKKFSALGRGKNVNRDELSNKVSGTILGMVIGDALGAPARGLTPYQAKKKFQTLDAFYPYEDQRPGFYTHCAQTALLCANALTKGSIGYGTMEAEYRNAKMKKVPDRVCKESFQRLEAGVPWPKCPEESRGSSWLERVVPVGLLSVVRPMTGTEILRACKVVSWPTHWHKPSVAFGGAVACVIRACITEAESHTNPYEMFGSDKSLMSRVVALLKAVDQQMEPEWATEDPIWIRAQETWRMLQRKATPEEFVGYFGLKDDCADAVCLALFLFMRNPGNMKAVQQAAILGGPSNITAGLVGAMCGAYGGRFFLAQDMIDAVENSPRLVAFCELFTGKLCEEMPKEA